MNSIRTKRICRACTDTLMMSVCATFFSSSICRPNERKKGITKHFNRTLWVCVNVIPSLTHRSMVVCMSVFFVVYFILPPVAIYKRAFQQATILQYQAPTKGKLWAFARLTTATIYSGDANFARLKFQVSMELPFRWLISREFSPIFLFSNNKMSNLM